MNHSKIQFLKIIICSHKSLGLLGCLYFRLQMWRAALLVSHLPLFIGSSQNVLRRGKGCKRDHPSVEVYLKPLLMLHVVTSHWPRQVTGSSPKSRRRNCKVTGKRGKMGPITESTTNVSRLRSIRLKKKNLLPKVKSTKHQNNLL